MRIDNQTRLPTAELRRVLVDAFGPHRPETVRVRIRAPGSIAAGSTSASGRVVHIGLHGGPYPIVDQYTRLRGAPTHELASWREELGLIAAHEAAHVAGVDDELHAERMAALYLARRRGHRVMALTRRWRRR